jgi:hypothetical protein
MATSVYICSCVEDTTVSFHTTAIQLERNKGYNLSFYEHSVQIPSSIPAVRNIIVGRETYH